MNLRSYPIALLVIGAFVLPVAAKFSPAEGKVQLVTGTAAAIWSLPVPEFSQPELEAEASLGLQAADKLSILEESEKVENAIDEYTKQLTQLADDAVSVGDGAPNAAVRGTWIHKRWENLAHEVYGNDVQTEQSFKDGIANNASGSIRVDLILKSPEGDPIAIFDLKTGKSGLTAGRINKIRSNLLKN